MSLLPDAILSEVETEQPRAIVIPGGRQGSQQLGTDPRIHALLGRVMVQGSYVVALETAHSVLHCAGVWNRNQESARVGQLWLDGSVIYGQKSELAQEAALKLASLLQDRD
jgi:4-methyl-5(b-hydroxyethyl)-thiazole monophosphate biosynthesis